MIDTQVILGARLDRISLSFSSNEGLFYSIGSISNRHFTRFPDESASMV
jgi:hypothetical protein